MFFRPRSWAVLRVCKLYLMYEYSFPARHIPMPPHQTLQQQKAQAEQHRHLSTLRHGVPALETGRMLTPKLELSSLN